MSIDLKRMQEAIRLCVEEMSRCYPDGTVIVAEPFHMAYIAGRDSMREELAVAERKAETYNEKFQHQCEVTDKEVARAMSAERKLAEIEEEADDGVRYHQSRGVSTLHLERILTIVRGEK